MTDTGGFAFLIAWAIFLGLCLILAYFVLRRPRRDPHSAQRDERPARPDRNDPPGRGGG